MSSPMQNESFDSGSNYQFGDKLVRPSLPRSMFDLSHLNAMTIPNAGLVVPIGLIETIPNSDYDISVRSLLRCLPQVVPLYSRQRLYTYAFYSRMGDLWKGFDTFIRKGYSGNVIKSIPKLLENYNFTIGKIHESNVNLLPCSLGDYLNLPVGVRYSSLGLSTSSTGVHVSALPFMMYFRIWRDYFCNRNYYINDRVILPDDDGDFRLDDDGVLISARSNSIKFNFDVLGNSVGIRYVTGTDGRYLDVSLFYHDYAADRFTSALPFPQRGDTPSLSFTVSGGEAPIKIKDNSGNVFNFRFNSNAINGTGNLFTTNGASDPLEPFSMSWSANSNVVGNDVNVSFSNKNFYADLSSSTSSLLTITLNQIRELAIKQLELEKMARTDGSFAEFGLTFFGERSKNAIDFKPVYIGGTYTNLKFTEVLQTSSTTNNSVLGQYAGHGIAGDDSGYIGHVHTDDYGYIMLLACVMPDTYYSQGVDKLFTRLLQSDMYLPERARLGMVPILNHEIFVGGTADDLNLWAYQDIFDELRYQPNRIHGKLADWSNNSFKVYTQSRHFDSLPNWGKEFANASNVRKDYLYAPSEDAYSVQFSLDIRAVQPLPYRASPASVIN